MDFSARRVVWSVLVVLDASTDHIHVVQAKPQIVINTHKFMYIYTGRSIGFTRSMFKLDFYAVVWRILVSLVVYSNSKLFEKALARYVLVVLEFKCDGMSSSVECLCICVWKRFAFVFRFIGFLWTCKLIDRHMISSRKNDFVKGIFFPLRT